MELGVGRLGPEIRDRPTKLAPGLADQGRRHFLGRLLGGRGEQGLGDAVDEGVEQGDVPFGVQRLQQRPEGVLPRRDQPVDQDTDGGTILGRNATYRGAKPIEEHVGTGVLLPWLGTDLEGRHSSRSSMSS